jgi:hypothetical protein
MSRQILEDDYFSFHLRQMERDVNMIKRNAEAIFKILDEYENLVESKYDA